MGLSKNKKGITPLVATILLIAFSVGLGALVMSWGQEYIEERAEFVQGSSEVRSGCDAAEIKVITIGERAQACVSSQGIEVFIDNGPSVDLYNIHARIAGTDDVQVIEEILSEPLLRSNAVRVVIPVSPAIGEVLQVRLTPRRLTGLDEVLCGQSSITIEQLPRC